MAFSVAYVTYFIGSIAGSIATLNSAISLLASPVLQIRQAFVLPYLVSNRRFVMSRCYHYLSYAEQNLVIRSW